MDAVERQALIRRIVGRANLEEFADRILDSFWERPEFLELHPPREQVRAWVRWNLDLVNRWLIEGRPPTDAELDVFREQARARAADGTPQDLVPANFRRGVRFAWRALLDAATDEERPALLDSAELLFNYVDQVSRIFSDAYQAAARSATPSPEESRARGLLHRLGRDEAALPEDHQLAERIGFRLDRPSRPFVVALPGRSAEDYATLAAHLRRRGALAASEGRWVAGLANQRAPWRRLELGPAAVMTEGHAAIGGERGRGLDELRAVLEVALARGATGVVEADEYLPELLLRRSPRIASQIHARVYGALDAAHPQLAHTLDVLVEHSFERAATAAALPVHRNTLRDRINRISELTGVDLDGVEGRGLSWLAWLQRRPSGRPVETQTSATPSNER